MTGPSPERGRTRLAPSPTGALHLGNARTFLLTWLLARRHGWHVLLRVEDIDGPRIKPQAARAAMQDLAWLGIDWDAGPVVQTDRLALYRAAVDRLLASGAAYPCVCTRKDIEQAASAPHAEDGAAVYPGTCRGRFASIDAARSAAGRAPAIRFRVQDGREIRWRDAVAGPQSFRLSALGDFIIAKGDGTPSYQLAVVVDDADAGVTDVVRGEDLLDSAARQIALYESLNLGPSPTYYHLPLVVGTDGRRLAKRHGDTRLATYRAAGVPAGRIVSWVARSAGIDTPPDDSLRAADLIDRFDLAMLPKAPVTMTDADHAWLMRAT